MKRMYLLKKDQKDHNDHLFFRIPIKLPPQGDLRNGCSPVVDQGELGSCTANAIASGAMEFNLTKANKYIPLSRLYLYYKEREAEGTITEDAGASIRDGIKIAVKNGVCPETDWAYDISKFTVKPPAKADKDATNYHAVSYQSISGLNDFKRCITEGYPVVFGMPVYETFESEEVARTGIVPMPKKGEKNLGGHAVCGVGYDDNRKVVIVRNSWGDSWGDKGYFYLSYDYLKKYCYDLWTLR